MVFNGVKTFKGYVLCVKVRKTKLEEKMKRVLDYIKEHNLIKEGQRIGVAVSGGVDSMALLHFLNNLSKEGDFTVFAITINHKIRQDSQKDNQLVIDYCKANQIKVNCFEVDALKYAKEKKVSVETAAREVRFAVLNSLLHRKVANQIALAHHQDDQAETVLMNLFRGAGVRGVGGMKPVRDGFIRPFLSTSKSQIEKYAKAHDLPIAQDETNFEDDYSRNYLRNQIMPLIESRWSGAAKNIASFAEISRQDSGYFEENINTHGVICIDGVAKVPTSYFLNHPAIYVRQLFAVLEKIGVKADVSRKHVEIIKDFALTSQSGKKINLPNKISVSKEYDFIVLSNNSKKESNLNAPFKLGKVKVEGFGEIKIKKVKSLSNRSAGELYLDADKVPKQAMWRFAKPKDKFTKFGGGTKSLKAFLVDKKVPARIRKTLPVLAHESTIYAVVGVEVSDVVKVDEGTKRIYKVSMR